jgi:hypothetical protein
MENGWKWDGKADQLNGVGAVEKTKTEKTDELMEGEGAFYMELTTAEMGRG